MWRAPRQLGPIRHCKDVSLWTCVVERWSLGRNTPLVFLSSLWTCVIVQWSLGHSTQLPSLRNRCDVLGHLPLRRLQKRRQIGVPMLDRWILERAVALRVQQRDPRAVGRATELLVSVKV